MNTREQWAFLILPITRAQEMGETGRRQMLAVDTQVYFFFSRLLALQMYSLSAGWIGVEANGSRARP